MAAVWLVGISALAACSGGVGVSDIADAEWERVYEFGSMSADVVTVTDRTAQDGPCLGVMVTEDRGTPVLGVLTAVFRDGVAADLVTGNVLDLIDAGKADCWRD